jgi:hypothetical protein
LQKLGFRETPSLTRPLASADDGDLLFRRDV